ncbi:3-(3-hydroxy-phenyl)propionate/3-hydroxycinnamic acid hydroxylase [Carnimonas sp. R-84981]|uniref:FAD-dependent oxidoreductase n=1 Tax=Carnimonas bestiolae TaxID=3402172 RepID=UPI003EDC8CFF
MSHAGSHGAQVEHQQCIIAGGGPGGLMLGLLLARAGVTVTVVEKHADFLRDFRGDTVHPSTLDVMDELGLLDEVLKIPHTRAEQLHAEMGGQQVTIADFSRLKSKCRFIAFMAQWDFLDFIAREARKYPNFRLLMRTEVTELTNSNGRITGIKATSLDGDITLHADLVVGADGRHSKVREHAGMQVNAFGVPTDVLWMKLSHQPNDPPYTMGHGGPRMGIVLIDRGDYWQCGYVIRKGSFDDIKAAGLDAFREEVGEALPLPTERMQEIERWNDVFLLRVRIDRLERWWKPGLLFIGDAAHAMSPIGGVGVNLAIQDAVATANILAAPLREGRLKDKHLAKVEKRRRFPTRATQKLQLMMKRRQKPDDADSTSNDTAAADQTPPNQHTTASSDAAAAPERKGPPRFVRALAGSPVLARLAGRLMGLGFRPEHIRHQAAPAVSKQPDSPNDSFS